MIRSTMIAVMAMAVVLMSGGAAGTTYYVDPNGDDNNDGLSWETAFATIQKGIDDANDGEPDNYDIIDVNSGSYVTDPIFLNNSNQKIIFEEGME